MKKLIVLGAFVLATTFATSCKKTTETETVDTETVVVPEEGGTEVDTATVKTTTEVETTVDTTKVN